MTETNFKTIQNKLIKTLEKKHMIAEYSGYKSLVPTINDKYSTHDDLVEYYG